MNAMIAGRLRALRNATPRADAAPTTSGAEGSTAPPSNAPVVVVSGDTPISDQAENQTAASDQPEADAIVVADDPGPSDPKKRK
ncbi:UNVERIFIED_CONTAM: hypothetical protein Sradi_1562900 [Sesamum radiatum]|uniref:Uncharacterized protein n=1 Tax=Sesamum radiatum TaxID=300843 RepID=A0AAW2UB45_SESRA